VKDHYYLCKKIESAEHNNFPSFIITSAHGSKVSYLAGSTSNETNSIHDNESSTNSCKTVGIIDHDSTSTLAQCSLAANHLEPVLRNVDGEIVDEEEALHLGIHLECLPTCLSFKKKHCQVNILKETCSN